MKTIKKIEIIIFIIMISFMFSVPTYATEKYTTGEIVEGSDKFIEDGLQGGSTIITAENLKAMSDTIYNILLVIGIIVAVIIGIIMGIKFVTGGIEEQAEVKKSLIPYMVGCVIVFGAFIIWKIVVTMLMGI